MFRGFCFQLCVMYQKFRLVIKIFLIRGIRMVCFCIFTDHLWWVCTKHLHFILYWTNLYTCQYFPSQKIPELHTSVSKIQPPPPSPPLFPDAGLPSGGTQKALLVWTLSKLWSWLFRFPKKERKNLKSLSGVWLVVTPWTVTYQAPPSMGFSSQEYWSGLPFPSPGHLPNPGIEPWSPAL